MPDRDPATNADAISLRAAVRARYAAAASAVTTTHPTSAESALPVLDQAGCCGTECCGAPDPSQLVQNLYTVDDVAELPSAAVLASLGCGNPTALAQLSPGETVLDLGSGGGIDVLLSARRVGPTGFAYGLDMTDEMLALASRNAAESGVENVRFLKGEIEQVPLPDTSVDVVISNCVINLSTDKAKVLREAFRVLRPGGRFAVSDVVVQGELPALVRKSVELWAGCVAGALEEHTYRRLLAEAGFIDVEVEVTRVYEPGEAWAVDEGRLVSAFVRATRPAA
ncbi:MAG: arsenite methyltransferase [Chloroflexi bacterium]|nr:MAG: arsenite methyltransferase [Chloroflexota bacterium]